MKVRLKPFPIGNIMYATWFQFHEGPIKTLLSSVVETPSTCFNSMKVRLKQSCVFWLLAPYTFQFHEGPIKTESGEREHHLHVVSIP